MQTSNLKSAIDDLLFGFQQGSLEDGGLVSGTILAVNRQGLYLDINQKCEAYISSSELKDDYISTYNVGDKLTALVIRKEKNNIYKLSIAKLEESENWIKLQELYDADTIVKVSVVKVKDHGIEVKIDPEFVNFEKIGFIPKRYIDNSASGFRNKNINEISSGLELEARILDLSKEKNKLILDHKSVSLEQRATLATQVLDRITVGDNIQGTVVNIQDFGVFLDIGGFDALLHNSEMSWSNSHNIVNGYKVIGKILDVVVISKDIEQKQIGVSIKQLEADPWTIVDQAEFAPGTIHKGVTVSSVCDFGVFVEFKPGFEGLVYKSNFEVTNTDTNGVQIDEEVQYNFPALGTLLDLEVTNLDVEQRRLGLQLFTVGDNQIDISKTEISMEKEGV